LRVGARLQNYLLQARAQAMPVELMERLAARTIPDYDLYRQSGFPPNIPIPQRDAARQVVDDIVRLGHLHRFAETLIEVDRNGIMGRAVSIRQLPRILTELEAMGFVFKHEYGQFVEGKRRTRGWGVLQEGQIYEFSFLRMDIAGNTQLVRKYPKTEVLKVYADLRGLFAAIVERREGRLWHWEGDGGVAAFFFGAKNVQACLSGMELLLELFMYNLLRKPLGGDLHVRLAVHTGPCPFQDDFKQIRSDTLRRLEVIESQLAAKDSLMISPGVHSDLGSKLAFFFQPVGAAKRHALYQYRLEWE